MTSSTPSEKRPPENSTKAQVTAKDVAEIKAIAAELKRISGVMFGLKRIGLGYDLRRLSARLGSIVAEGGEV